jgi:lipopolysaccharide export system permease protein
MNRFQSALTREMAAMAAMVFIALTAIFAVVVLVRTLGHAAIGELAGAAVLPMLGFGVLRFLPVLLSLALFVGVFMTLSRIWRESEAVIWMGAGIGPWGWLRPLFLFSLPMFFVIGWVSLELIPWSAGKQAQFEQILKTRDDVSNLSPGAFSEDTDGKRVYFVESMSDNGQKVAKVFVETQQQGRMGVVVARRGHLETHANGDRFLVLENGKRYEGIPGEADFRTARFVSYAVRVQPEANVEQDHGPRLLGARELLSNPTPRNMGEFVWRIGYPISALLLALLALPLSYVNPRAGRSLNVVFAILIYVAYNNFVGLSDGWVARSQVTMAEGLILVHGTMLIVLSLFLWTRFRGPWGR